MLTLVSCPLLSFPSLYNGGERTLGIRSPDAAFGPGLGARDGSRAWNEWVRVAPTTAAGNASRRGEPASVSNTTLLELPRSPPTTDPSATTKPVIQLPKPAEDPALAPGAASRDLRGGPFKS